MSVPVRVRPAFETVGPPKKLFRIDGGFMAYDVASDGQRFVVVESAGKATRPVIRVVQNWFEEFRDRQ